MSLTRPLIVALFFALLGAMIFFHPTSVQARYVEANTQCPPGGKIGQPCKDNTNGYVTQGKCAYVYVCKAEAKKGPTPPICAGGKSDCPTGGPPPNYTPTPRPIKIASSSPVIPKDGISGVEQSVLNSVFGNSEAVDPSVDLEEVSAQANAQLLATQDYSQEEDLLYVPESFDTRTSTLFTSLREQAVMLQPGQGGRTSGGGLAENIRLAYATGGFFGGSPYSAETGGGGGGQKIADSGRSLMIDLLAAPRNLASAVYNSVRALVSILLADFTTAGNYWADARLDMGYSLMYLGNIFVTLWHMLLQLIFGGVQTLTNFGA